MNFLRTHSVEIAASSATILAVIALFIFAPFPHAARPAATTLRALSGQTRYSIDLVTIGNRTSVLHFGRSGSLEAARDEPIGFTGWAIDAAARAPVSGVAAVVDGDATFVGSTGLRRDDVAAALDDPGLALSGFTVSLPGCVLRSGPHRIAFHFFAADARGYYRSNDDVDLSEHLDPSHAGRVLFAIDSIVPPLASRGEHRVVGWLVDAGSCAPADGVRVSVDGHAVATAAYGRSRPDVASVFHVPEYERSGFDAEFSDAGLALGRHVLRLAAIRSGRSDVDAGFALPFVR